MRLMGVRRWTILWAACAQGAQGLAEIEEGSELAFEGKAEEVEGGQGWL